MTINTKSAVIVLGGSPTALSIIRELGEHGVRLCNMVSEKNCASYSRFLTHHIPLIVATSELRVKKLIQFAKFENEKPAIIASSDQDLAFLHQHQDELSKYFNYLNSINLDLSTKLMDKAFLYQLCDQHHIARPASFYSNKDAAILKVNAINTPCLIKPTLIHEVKAKMAGKKVFICPDKESLNQQIKNLPEGNTEWLFQEIISGSESNIYLFTAFFDKHSKAHQKFTARKLRQFPPGFGSASKVVSEYNPIIEKLCEDFFSSIGFQGIIAAEFKFDITDNTFKMIEVNPRPSLWFASSYNAQKSICLASYCYSTNQELPSESPQKSDILWKDPLKDLYSKAFYCINTNFILPVPKTKIKTNKKVYATWHKKDKKPSIYEFLFLCRKAAKRIFSKIKTYCNK